MSRRSDLAPCRLPRRCFSDDSTCCSSRVINLINWLFTFVSWLIQRWAHLYRAPGTVSSRNLRTAPLQGPKSAVLSIDLCTRPQGAMCGYLPLIFRSFSPNSLTWFSPNSLDPNSSSSLVLNSPSSLELNSPSSLFPQCRSYAYSPRIW